MSIKSSHTPEPVGFLPVFAICNKITLQTGSLCLMVYSSLKFKDLFPAC